jgi:hypothetical protein
MTMLTRMEKLNLVSLGTGRADSLSGNSRFGGDAVSNRQVVTFDPSRITERAQQVADQDLDIAINSELELIELADLEALIGVERKMLLSKLSHDEIAEDVFAFRKTKVLHYVEEKGVSYFSKRARGSGEVKSLEDIEFVDHRTLFDAVSATDTYDLAKLAASAGDQAIVDKLLSVMTEARKKEVSWVMRRDLKIDQAEVDEIELRFLQTIRELKAASGRAPERMSREA